MRLSPTVPADTCHPVDQKMALGVVTQQGSWRESPEIGTDYGSIVYAGAGTQAQVERVVREGHPTAELLASGDVVIAGIAYEFIPTGGIVVSVDYVNTRLDKNRVQRVSNR